MSTPFYDLASLVVVPSGYKSGKIYAQKPLTTDGQLTFSRSTAASRVASNGLIEKVRTNLALQSNSFDTTWAPNNASVAGGQAGYDGTNNAWGLTSSLSGGNIAQSSTQSGLQTFSVYAKGSVSNGIRVYTFGGVNANAYFNLNLGTVVAVNGSGATAKIESVGGGWYRCSITFDQTNVSIRFYPSDNATTMAAGTIYIQDAQLETGDIATEPILTTSAAVSVGPVANVPRLDYLGSSCPRLLLEPQRTNILPQSQYFGGSEWTKSNASVTGNNATSPEGIQNASLLTISAAVGNIYENVGGSGNFTFSVFAKYVDMQYMRLRSTASYVYFDIQNGSVETEISGTGSIEDYGNGWYRCSVIGNNTNSLAQIFLSDTESGTPTGTGSALIYGAQFEAGNYVTSLIPTYGASVTRGADGAAKTASLFNQNNFTLYFEHFVIDGQGSSSPMYSLYDSGGRNVQLYVNSNAGLNLYLASDGGYVFGTGVNGGFNANATSKVIVKYDGTNIKYFINGALYGSYAVSLGFTSRSLSYETSKSYKQIQTMFFPIALSDADCISLTA
jgi:hypothetical protein